MEQLEGKVAVVTGAGSGIGKALAERFVAEGMSVVLADIDEVRLRLVESQLSESGGNVFSEGLFTELQGTGSPVGVSVLCPGFVHTELMTKMTWAARLGDEPADTTNPVGQFMDQILRDGVETGISPADVAGCVVDAIRANRFWILTHPDYAPAVTERFRKAVAQENP